jgi:arylsulfatase A-like enzyme
MLLAAAAAIGLVIGLRWGALRVLRAATVGLRPATLAGASCATAAAVLALSGALLWRQKLPYSQAAQPIVAFTASLFQAEAVVIPAIAPSQDVADFAPRAAERAETAPVGAGRPAVRNVVFFVMESAAAEYFGLYGSTLGATPELDKRRSSSLIVSDAYAHAPNTNMSLVSLLTGSYPWVTARLITAEHPDIRLSSISSLLQARGYRTGFFSAADLQFHKAEQFLAHHGFEAIEDHRTIPCEAAPYKGGWKETFSSRAVEHLDGTTDECAVRALTDWIGRSSTEPFFGVVWTNQAHYPYVFRGAKTAFPVKDRDLDRYLNALKAGDRALGQLLAELEARGLADSTLVVVLGDHGQAFGRHGDRIHGSAVYEANIRIPLVFINKALFHGEVAKTVGGVVDVAPTVAELIGLPPGETWQGRSFLDRSRPNRTYFFTPWADVIFGYRDGDLKYLFNSTYNRFEVFDLARDPLETTDLSGDHAAQLPDAQRRLATWVQFQDRFIRSFAPSASGSADAGRAGRGGRVE